MNEKETKELIEKSIIPTSDGFTDKLMLRLEAREVDKKTAVWRFIPTISAITVVVLAVNFVVYKYLESGVTLFSTDLKVDGIPIFLATTVLLLIAINHILKLNHIYSISKSNPGRFKMES